MYACAIMITTIIICMNINRNDKVRSGVQHRDWLVLGAALSRAQGNQLLNSAVLAGQIVQNQVHGGPCILLAVVTVFTLDSAAE